MYDLLAPESYIFLICYNCVCVWCWAGMVQWVCQSFFVENSCLEARLIGMVKLSHKVNVLEKNK